MIQAQNGDGDPEPITDVQFLVSSFVGLALALLETHIDTLDGEPYYDADNPEPVTDEQLEQDELEEQEYDYDDREYQDYLASLMDRTEAGFVVTARSCARGCYFHPRRRRCMRNRGGRCLA